MQILLTSIIIKIDNRRWKYRAVFIKCQIICIVAAIIFSLNDRKDKELGVSFA